MTQDEKEMEHRMTFHKFLREHASLSPSRKGLVPIAWIVTLCWFSSGSGRGGYRQLDIR